MSKIIRFRNRVCTCRGCQIIKNEIRKKKGDK